MSCLEIDDVLLNHVENDNGFFLGLSFRQDELDLVRSLVEMQWLENIKRYIPEHYNKFLNLKIERYHQLSHLVDHASMWQKVNRILPHTAVDLIRSTSLITALENLYGQFQISDEDAIGREEIYWRLVRPNQPSDVGPIHADAWFWDLGHGVTPQNVKRVKVWIALFCEPGLSGLCLVPGAHMREWKYHGEFRDGLMKPCIDEDIEKLPIQLVPTKPGDAIVFHDKLLHGGAINKGMQTRVSIEFTMFVKNK